MRKKWLMIAGGTVMFGVFCLAVLYLVLLFSGENLLRENIGKLELDSASVVLDDQEQPVTSLYRENRQIVRYPDIPPMVRNAFVAVEDKRFYEHTGVDVRAFFRAVVTDIILLRKAEGGSTITQQLAKNMFLTNEKTITRKLKEMAIAMALENQLTKDEIIEKYLNRIYFGGGAYGVKAASLHYFEQPDLHKLEVWQIATLVAMAKSPKYYSPILYPERSRQRRAVVLQLMYDQNLISKEVQQEAAAAEYVPKEDNKNNPYLTVMDYVLDEAAELYGLDDDRLLRGGFKIHTTISRRAQDAVESAFRTESNFPPAMNGVKPQAAMVILDHKDGGVKAMIGGRDTVARGLNRTLLPRQPGSAIKPVVSFGAAIELGWNPYDQVTDEAAEYAGYKPKNHDNTYLGSINMFSAIKTSQNAAAVWLLNQIGVEKGYDFGRKLGLNLVPEDKNLSLALGGLSKGVTPLAMANAYSAFANGGKLNRVHIIRKITDADGVEVAVFAGESKQVISPRTAYFVTRLMQSVVEPGGTGTGASFRQPVSGKTGTTQVGIPGVNGGNRDIWFVGNTPQWTAAVWMGFDRTNKKQYLKVSSSRAARLFGKVMSKSLANRKVGQFVKPAEVPELAPANREIADLTAVYSSEENSVMLKWSPLEGISLYRVYRSMGAQPAEMIAETESNELKDFAVLPAESYIYTVIPLDPANKTEGKPSNAVTVQTILADQLPEGGLPDGELLPEQTDAVDGGMDQQPAGEAATPSPEPDDRQLPDPLLEDGGIDLLQ